jgi:hypothetical protein
MSLASSMSQAMMSLLTRRGQRNNAGRLLVVLLLLSSVNFLFQKVVNGSRCSNPLYLSRNLKLLLDRVELAQRGEALLEVVVRLFGMCHDGLLVAVLFFRLFDTLRGEP